MASLNDIEVIMVEVPTGPQTISVTQPGPTVASVVKIPGMQGPSAMSIGPVNNLSPGIAGLWIETGLGPDGEDFTFWIEDGR